MDLKEDVEVVIEDQADQPTSPLLVLQQISEDAVKVVNEAIFNAYNGGGGGSNDNSLPVWTGHRRAQSEVYARGGHRRSNSLQNFKTQIQKAWKWGANSAEEDRQFNFDPEELADQKRQWYQHHQQANAPDWTKYKEPNVLFEHFVVTGLHPDANLEAVEDAFAKKKKRGMERSGSNSGYYKHERCPEPEPPSLEPQILFKYPPGKKLPMRPKDLCAFSFPGGVKARMVERTPSLSCLNELVYGKGHLGRDDLAFVFSLKVADNATLYGVCLHVPEIVQRPPGILGSSSPLSHSHRTRSRFLISAPRCYCLLTRVPFFELHYEMLSSIIAQERLNRITHFLNKMNATESYMSTPRTSEQSYGFLDSPCRECPGDWTSSVIPIDSAVALTAAAAGIIPDDEAQSFSVRTEDTLSPPSICASEASDFGASTDPDKDGEKGSPHFDDRASEVSEESFQTVMHSPETPAQRLDQSDSSASLYSPARSLDAQDDIDEFSFIQESDSSGDFMTMKWAKEQKNEFLQIVCAYGALSVPARGNDIVFCPLEHLQPIQYRRPSISDLGFDDKLLEIACRDPLRSAEVNAKLTAAEEALALSVWTTATICRVISLDNILALVAGVLLEKQVLVTCPNLGVLSATVLSLVSMIRPFEWQSLLLPVLPESMMDFLDAPVPYLVGLDHKPSDMSFKTFNLVQIDVLEDQMSMCQLPSLPRRKELVSQLRPLHARLAAEGSIAERHPVYRSNVTQAEAAKEFIKVMRRYLESLCSDIRFYTITSVQSNHERISILLKDSFIDSFPRKDRPFVKLWVDTQMFTVLSDSHLLKNESLLF